MVFHSRSTDHFIFELFDDDRGGDDGVAVSIWFNEPLYDYSPGVSGDLIHSVHVYLLIQSSLSFGDILEKRRNINNKISHKDH